MDATFGLLPALPPAGTLIGRIIAWPGAMGATDAGVSLVVEQVVRHLMLQDITPDLALGPIRQRIDFNQLILRIPHHQG